LPENGAVCTDFVHEADRERFSAAFDGLGDGSAERPGALKHRIRRSDGPAVE